MSTQAISNSTTQASEIVSTFKLEQLQMNFENDRLHLTLKAHFLNAFNYWFTVKSGVLTLKVITPLTSTSKSTPVTIPIYIPKKEYTQLRHQHFEGNTLYVELSQENDKSRLHSA